MSIFDETVAALVAREHRIANPMPFSSGANPLRDIVLCSCGTYATGPVGDPMGEHLAAAQWLVRHQVGAS